MQVEAQLQLMQKTGFKIKKRMKYSGVTPTNKNLFYFKTTKLTFRMKFKNTF